MCHRPQFKKTAADISHEFPQGCRKTCHQPDPLGRDAKVPIGSGRVLWRNLRHATSVSLRRRTTCPPPPSPGLPFFGVCGRYAVIGYIWGNGWKGCVWKLVRWASPSFGDDCRLEFPSNSTGILSCNYYTALPHTSPHVLGFLRDRDTHTHTHQSPLLRYAI